MSHVARRRILLLLLSCCCSATVAAGPAPDEDIYTLYRDSVVPGVTRVHIATFDTSDGRDYNRENCMIARDLFLAQDGVAVNYWCEPGRFRE